jgi:ribose/xylose/arabinose/galactoside ABC-type transport system permease subunit
LSVKRKGFGSEYKDVIVLMLGIVALFVFMSIFATGFLSWYNIQNMLKDFSIMLIVSIGMTIAILLGKIDMSAGSVMSLSAIVTTLVLANGGNIVVALLAGISSGAGIGLLNGYLIGVMKLNFFIATFATMSMAKGIALIACDGKIINSTNSGLLYIGTGKLAGLFVIIWIAIILFVGIYFVLRKTTFGYRIYSIGGSENVATLSGIKTKKIYIQSYILIGILAAVAGICMAGKASSGNVTMGDGFEFSAIAIVLIGGTPFSGGKGGLLGTIVGALLIAILKSGISMLGITPAWQYAIIGIVILAVIVVDVAINAHRESEEKRRIWQ